MIHRNKPKTFVTLRQFAEKHTFISLGAIRQLVHLDRDFRKHCVRKLGTKILLNEENVIDYIENTIDVK